MAYVAYTEMGPSTQPGTKVVPEDFDEETWQYYLDHGVVVLQGGERDPNVLEARAAGEAYEDPRDQRIADLEAELARLRGDSISGDAAAKDEKPPEKPAPVASPEQKAPAQS